MAILLVFNLCVYYEIKTGFTLYKSSVDYKFVFSMLKCFLPKQKKN